MSEQNTENVEKKEENNPDEIDKETLLQLLKDKSREMKTLNAKLQKLENKYVTLFKDSKKQTKDRDNFMKFLNTVFGLDNTEEAKQIVNAKLGDIEHSKMQQLFFNREASKEETMNKVMQELHEEKKKLEDQFKQRLKEQVSHLDQGNQDMVQQLQDQIDELENNNSKLSKEVIELNQVIKSKNDQLQSFEKEDDMIKKMKTEQLISELQSHNQKTSESQNVNRKIQEAQYQNEILNYKNQLDQAQEKIDELEEKLKGNAPVKSPQQLSLERSQSLQKQAKKQAMMVNSETQTDSILDVNTGQFVDRVAYGNEQFNKVYGLQIEEQEQQQKLFQLQLKQQQLQQQQQLDPEDPNVPQTTRNSSNSGNNNLRFQAPLTPTDRSKNFSDFAIQDNISPDKIKLKEDYLKNVILKYFEYLESRQHKEASLLQNSIMTILKMSHEERARIDNARQQGSIWNATLSYIPFLNKNNQQQQGGGGQGLNQSMQVEPSYKSEILQTQ